MTNKFIILSSSLLIVQFNLFAVTDIQANLSSLDTKKISVCDISCKKVKLHIIGELIDNGLDKDVSISLVNNLLPHSNSKLSKAFENLSSVFNEDKLFSILSKKALFKVPVDLSSYSSLVGLSQDLEMDLDENSLSKLVDIANKNKVIFS